MDTDPKETKQLTAGDEAENKSLVTRVKEGTSALKDRAIDEACAAITGAVSIRHENRVGPILRRTREVRASLEPWRDEQLVKDLDEQLRPLLVDAPVTTALRQTVRARRDLVAHRVAVANQLRAHLQIVFPGAVGLFADIDSEREVVLEEIAMYEDDPQDKVFDVLGEAVFGGHPLGRAIIGRADVVGTTGPDALRAFHAVRYVPSNVVVAAAGSVDHDRLVALVQEAGIEREGASAPAFPGAPDAQPARVRFFAKDTEQYHVCLGAPGVSRTDERRYAASLLDAIVGGSASSRLFQEIREKRGMAYSVYSFASQYTDTGQIGLYVGTRPDNLAVTYDARRALGLDHLVLLIHDASFPNRADEETGDPARFLIIRAGDERLVLTGHAPKRAQPFARCALRSCYRSSAWRPASSATACCSPPTSPAWRAGPSETATSGS